MVEISPSILAADFARLGDQVDDAARGGARMLHVDVMDGRFVPNISIGVPVVESLSRHTNLVLDCHLMVESPDTYILPFREAGARMITVHQEACPHLARTVDAISDLGAAAGVALNPATPLSTLEEILPWLDLVLIMSVNPGFGGQEFMDSTFGRVKRLNALRSDRELGFRIQVDGGVNAGNAQQLGEAGCDILVAGSSVFGSGDVAGAVRALSDCANLPATTTA